MGLQAKPNGIIYENRIVRDRTQVVQQNQQKAIELFDVPESDNLTNNTRVTTKQKFPLSKEDESYMVQCLGKHGTNYTKMFRDTKINYLQHTEDKLRKLGSRFLLLQPNQRRYGTSDTTMINTTNTTSTKNKISNNNNNHDNDTMSVLPEKVQQLINAQKSS